MADKCELPEVSLQSYGQNEASLLFQAQGIASPAGLSGAGQAGPSGGKSFGEDAQE